MTVAIGTPDPNKQRDIQAELADLRRHIAELEGTKKQLEQQVSSTNAVVEVAPAITTPEELLQTLQGFVRRVAMILQAEKAVIMLYEAESGELVAQSPALKLNDEEIAAFRVKITEGISGEAFREGHPIICNNCQNDERTLKDLTTKLRIRDALTVPMVVERRNENQQVVDRTIIGVLHVFNKRYGLKFTDEDVRLLIPLGRNAAAIISSARVFQQLTEQKKQLEYTLQSMNFGLFVLSRNNRINLMNNVAASFLELHVTDDIGQPYITAIKNTEFSDFLTKSLDEERETAADFIVSDRFYRAETTKVRDERKNAIGLLCVINDVTELRNVERMKSDFVSTVSHELRTPLTSIKGFVSTLLSDPDGAFDQDTRMEFYGIIDSECDRLVNMINDLLNVSRIESGRPPQLNYDTVDISAVLEKCLTLQRTYTTKHQLVVDAPPGLPTIVADRDRLTQILTNLLSNAIKYSPDGGLITTKIVDEGDKLRFAVIDQGMGIPPEHVNKVFQRFHRVHSGDSQRVGGTGIGLFLVKSLVEAHGGVAWVESAIGKGSTFFFTIPKQPLKEPA